MLNQRTITNPIKAMGVGLHSGKKVVLELLPAPADSGISFIRSDLEPNVEIPRLNLVSKENPENTPNIKNKNFVCLFKNILSKDKNIINPNNIS